MTTVYDPVDAQLIAKELLAPVQHKHPRRRVIVYKKDEIFSADLVEMPNEQDYRYILTVIDCFTRYAWAIPLKNKTGVTITEAFKTIFKYRKPEKLWVDKGKEFYNSTFQSFLKQNNITLYSTESELKASMIERLNRTLRDLMEREFTVQELTGKKKEWLPILPKIVSEYNNRQHRSIGFTPAEASKYPILVNTNFINKIQDPKYDIGTPVRIYKYKAIFEKGYRPRWTTEVFYIDNVHPTDPLTYSVKDASGEEIKGRFYSAELKPTIFNDKEPS